MPAHKKVYILYFSFIIDENNPYTSYILGFSVYISNTTSREDGVMCFRDVDYTRATVPNPVNINCPYHGRYVIYYNNRTYKPYPDEYSSSTYSDLCEVEVLGDKSIMFLSFMFNHFKNISSNFLFK